MRTRKDARRDEWDARLMPAKTRRVRGAGRGQGLTLMLLGVGIPLVLFFIQADAGYLGVGKYAVRAIGIIRLARIVGMSDVFRCNHTLVSGKVGQHDLSGTVAGSIYIRY